MTVTMFMLGGIIIPGGIKYISNAKMMLLAKMAYRVNTSSCK